MPIKKLKTETDVSKLKMPTDGSRIFYWDGGYENAIKGFGVKATKSGLTYIVQRRAGGNRGSKLIRYKIGAVSATPIDQARKEAAAKIRHLEDGIDVNEEKRQEAKEREIKGITLAEAYEEFKSSKERRPRTTQTYDENMNRTLKDWLDKPLASITPEMVLKKHKEISTAGRNGRGVASANQAMRLIRVIFNYVIATKNDGNTPAIVKNPVEILNQLDMWNSLEARDRTVHPDDLSAWYKAVMAQESEKMKDFFLFLMFSGLRRNECMQLELEHFDIRSKVLTIPAAISKTKKTRKIPLTDVLLEIFLKRKAAHIASGKPAYLFQGRHGKGHLKEPKRGVYDVRDKSGIDWASHDLRRTYVTTADRLDISANKVKFLVGHSVSGDVTGKHYSKLTVDDVRDAAQNIANYLKERMGFSTISTDEASV